MTSISDQPGAVAGWVQCPQCGDAVPIGLGPLTLHDLDGQQVANVDLEMDDLWAHQWTHKPSDGDV